MMQEFDHSCRKSRPQALKWRICAGTANDYQISFSALDSSLSNNWADLAAIAYVVGDLGICHKLLRAGIR